MSTTPIVVLDHAAFEVTLTPGIVADEGFVKRDGQTLVGVAAADITTGIATTALAIRTTTGPTDLTIAAIADTEILTRSGTTIDGVLPANVTVGTATQALGITTGATALTIGTVADGTMLARSGTTVTGLTQQNLAEIYAALAETITPVNAATYSWDTAARNLGVTYVVAQCDITLPDETQLTNWVPSERPRKLLKQNTTAFSVGLIAPANITINGAAAGTDMTTIPGFNADPSETVMAPYCYVYRESSTAFWVWGAQS